MDYSGSSHETELYDKLQNVMVRRLKADVLQELPPKQRSVIPVKIHPSEQAHCQRIMEELGDSKQALASTGEAEWESKSKLMLAYQASGVGKAQAIADYVSDWLDGSGTQKILLFAHHKIVMDKLDQHLHQKHPHSHIRIDGSVATAARGPLVRKFQTCARTRVALLSLTAAGVGLTLTAASTVLFAELHWTPGVLAQAEDRAHRIGQTHNSVQILYMVCKDSKVSLDLAIWNLLAKKIGTLDKVVDGRKETPYLKTAKEAEDVVAPRSVEEELTAFFAESQSEHVVQQRPSSGRGSIASFFQKKADSASKASTPAARKRVDTAWACGSCTFENTGSGPCQMCGAFDSMTNSHPRSATQPVVTATPVSRMQRSSTESGDVTWMCSVCTFENTVPRKSTAWYSCSMCSEPFESQPVPTVQPNQFQTPSEERSCHNTKRSSSPVQVSVSSKKVCQRPVERRDVDVVVLDGAESDNCSSFGMTDTFRSKEPDVICLDDDDDTDQQTKATSIAFAVSANTGRILVESQPINFAVDDILAKSTSDRLLDNRVKKSGATLKPLEVRFDEESLSRLAQQLPGPLSTNKDQITSFVRTLLSLRAIEKKALQDSGRYVREDEIRSTVAGLLVSGGSTTDRYIGGAKERAREKHTAGDELDASDRAVLDGKACAWCAKTLSRASRIAGSAYCSQACAEEGRLKRGGRFAGANLRAAVFALESGVCTLCGVNAQTLYEQILTLAPSERLNKLLSVGWKLPQTAKAMERLLNDPREGDFWQADHIQAVAEGGGGSGLENLRTLCVPCHQVETAKLHGRMKRGPTGVGQRDIRDALAGHAAPLRL